jgi:electron transfer DM13
MSGTSHRVNMILIILVILIAGWFFISPLFIDKTVDEAFIFPNKTSMPTRSEMLAMDDNEREHTMKIIMSKMVNEPDQIVDEDIMPITSPIIVGHGKFKDADKVHRGSGEVFLYKLEDGSHIVRLENFRVTNGPDLVVYLTNHPNPTNATEVKAGYLEIGQLKGNVGNQNYLVSSGTDISAFNSIVIWCDLFDVLFSPAALISP